MEKCSSERVLTVELPPGLKLLSANDRSHFYARAKQTKVIREAAAATAGALDFDKFGTVRIRCVFRAPDNRRRDVANLYLSFKAAIDGLVDAGVLEDDSDRYVRELTIVRGENLKGTGQLIIEVREAGSECT